MSYENADKVEGETLSFGSQTLDSAAKALQVSRLDFEADQQSREPLSNVCAFLHGYHSYAHDPSRGVSTYHYCAHLNEGLFILYSADVDMRQCLLYSSNSPNARLIGMSQMDKN